MAKKPSYDGSATCSGCDTRWTGHSRCHCSQCHRTFGGIGLFDQHRRGECLDPETILNKTGEHVMFLRDGIWRGPEFDAARIFGTAA